MSSLKFFRKEADRPVLVRTAVVTAVSFVIIACVTLVVSLLRPTQRISDTLAGLSFDIPFPQATDFDEDTEARLCYLRAFEDGYRGALRGHAGDRCSFGRDDRRGLASSIGYMQGQVAAIEVRAEQERQRLQLRRLEVAR